MHTELSFIHMLTRTHTHKHIHTHEPILYTYRWANKHTNIHTPPPVLTISL